MSCISLESSLISLYLKFPHVVERFEIFTCTSQSCVREQKMWKNSILFIALSWITSPKAIEMYFISWQKVIKSILSLLSSFFFCFPLAASWTKHFPCFKISFCRNGERKRNQTNLILLMSLKPNSAVMFGAFFK